VSYVLVVIIAQVLTKLHPQHTHSRHSTIQVTRTKCCCQQLWAKNVRWSMDKISGSTKAL